MYHFCTYFDRNYLLRGLTMYRSLVASGFEFVLHVLALDEETYDCIQALKLKNLLPVRLGELEGANPGLIAAKANRSKIEYYFTLTPFLPLHLLDQRLDIELITYVDADLYFYGSPAPIFEELGEKSILICEHRYSARLQHKLEYGVYNVQFQVFRRNAVGLACLQRWRDQCLAWCHDRVEGDRYADQKYLDEWPRLYGEQLIVVQNKAAGLAPWNWTNEKLVLESDTVSVGSQSLIFYHFHGLKIFNRYLISNGLSDWGVMPFRLLRWFYAGYFRHIRETRQWVREKAGMDLPLRDKITRGAGVSLATAGEILRKAWSQAMFVP